MKPTNAQIAAKVSVDWLIGSAAWLKSVASKSAGSTFRWSAASLTNPARTSPLCPGRRLRRRCA